MNQSDWKNGYIAGMQIALDLAELAARYDQPVSDIVEGIQALITNTKNQKKED